MNNEVESILKMPTCSTHGIKLLPWSGGSANGKYTSRSCCPLCGEIQQKVLDLETKETEITIHRKGVLRVHYFKVDSDLNVRIAACIDCSNNHYICVKEKANGKKSAFCPGHKKFIRSWDRMVSWVKIPSPIQSLELRGVMK